MYRVLRKRPITGNLELTERDLMWLRAIHQFRFITTDQACHLAGVSTAGQRASVNERLAKLRDHDFMQRPEVQLGQAHRSKRHVVHALGQRGAKELEARDKVKFPKGKGWYTANRLKSFEWMEHRIGTISSVLLFRQAFAGLNDWVLEYEPALLSAAPQWPKGLKLHRLPTKRMINGQMVDRGTDPDYTLGMMQCTEGGHRSLLFLELDCDTEDYVRSNRRAATMEQKHECYIDAFTRKLPLERYGVKGFRVPFVIDSPRAQHRIQSIQEMYQRRFDDRYKNLFMYTTLADLERTGPLGEIWTNAMSEPVHILPRGSRNPMLLNIY